MSDSDRKRAWTGAGLVLGAAGAGAVVFAIGTESVAFIWLACCVALAGPVLVVCAHKPKDERRQRGFEVTVQDRSTTLP